MSVFLSRMFSFHNLPASRIPFKIVSFLAATRSKVKPLSFTWSLLSFSLQSWKGSWGEVHFWGSCVLSCRVRSHCSFFGSNNTQNLPCLWTWEIGLIWICFAFCLQKAESVKWYHGVNGLIRGINDPTEKRFTLANQNAEQKPTSFTFCMKKDIGILRLSSHRKLLVSSAYLCAVPHLYWLSYSGLILFSLFESN